MGMDLGGGGGPKSEINVTPLVDVVLVLLIIFMVVQPLLQMGYDVQVPPNAPVDQPPQSTPDQIVVSMTATKESLSAVKTLIGDVDYAAETSELTRQNVLMQSAMSLLGMANQQSAQILSLL